MAYGNLNIEETADGLTIKIPWSLEKAPNKDAATTAGVGLVFMATGILLFAQGGFWVLLAAVFVLFPGLMIFQLLLTHVNTTVVTITADQIQASSRPFPFTGTFGMSPFSIPRDGLKQVVVEDYSLPSVGSVTTLVQVVDTRDKAYKLFQFQRNAHLAYELEDAIESYLGVENVAGAVSPRYREAQDFLNMVQDEQALGVAASLINIVNGDVGEIAALIRNNDIDELIRRSKTGDINDLIQRIKNPPTPDEKLSAPPNPDAPPDDLHKA
jgi:hypothetical protein